MTSNLLILDILDFYFLDLYILDFSNLTFFEIVDPWWPLMTSKIRLFKNVIELLNRNYVGGLHFWGHIQFFLMKCLEIILFFQMMHGSKRNEIVLFRANADLAQPVTYFIPEVSLWKSISSFQISRTEFFFSKKIFLVVLSNWSGLFGGWRDSTVGFGIEKTSLYWRRWQSNSY